MSYSWYAKFAAERWAKFPLSGRTYALTRDNFAASGVTIPPLRHLTIMMGGLAGEAGEVEEHLKKLVRDGVLDREALKKELGDVAFYWHTIVREFGFTEDEVLKANRKKILDREARGTLTGSGDKR